MLEFSADLTAAYVHDVKNTLCLLMSKADVARDVESMHLLMEANYKLNHLLILYKTEGDMLNVNVDAISPMSFLQILGASYQPITKKRVVIQDGDEDQIAYFDKGLIELCLGNAIHNADRYAASTITLSAHTDNGMTVLRVSDDGEGYPQEIIDSCGVSVVNSSSSSGLGLYLSTKIAEKHTNKNQHGYVKIYNDHGAVFEMFLP